MVSAATPSLQVVNAAGVLLDGFLQLFFFVAFLAFSKTIGLFSVLFYCYLEDFGERVNAKMSPFYLK